MYLAILGRLLFIMKENFAFNSYWYLL